VEVDDDQSIEHLFVVNLNITQYLHYIRSRSSKSFGISQRAWGRSLQTLFRYSDL
jgi:hypothetical protein